jgi:hypothetical protein
MKKLFLVLTVVLIALVGCQAQPSPEELLAAMEDALNGGDVDAAMAFFTDDAVVKLVPALPPGSPDTFTSAEEIRAWFEELVAMNFEIHVYIVQDGKIRGFTWTISDESLAKIQAAMAPPPLEQAIVGTWSWDTASTYFQFNEDGTYRYHLCLNKLEQEPADIGQYQVEGTVLTFISGDETRVCKAGDHGSYEITITEEGKLQLVLQEDGCSTARRAPSRDPQLFTRVPPSSLPPTVTPTSPPPAPTTTPQPTPTPELVKVTVTTVEDIVGVWEGNDTGALQFNADGTMLLSESLAGLTDQASHGEFWFEGSVLTFADADGSGEGSYDVELRTAEGNPVSLKFRVVKDPFVERREILTQRVWYWVEP